MYPKQPFDFAGRTGTVSFDVSNDTHLGHGAWPEFWITDLPIPAPFAHFAGPFASFPQNGFGIRLDGGGQPGQQGTCTNGSNLGVSRWTIESVVISRNYVIEDTLNGTTSMVLTILDCVINSPDNSGILNHVEVRVSQSQIDVYATMPVRFPRSSTLRSSPAPTLVLLEDWSGSTTRSTMLIKISSQPASHHKESIHSFGTTLHSMDRLRFVTSAMTHSIH